tara:strand:+ start:2880 stop:3164 length:285 start_codon:yes stop_codon:yes gene_type:complete
MSVLPEDIEVIWRPRRADVAMINYSRLSRRYGEVKRENEILKNKLRMIETAMQETKPIQAEAHKNVDVLISSLKKKVRGHARSSSSEKNVSLAW